MNSLAEVNSTAAYLPTSLFTQFFDMEKKTYTQHPVLHKVQGPDLLEHAKIIGGEDCMFADLISQRRSPAEAVQSWTTEARTALRKQLLEKRYHRATPDRHTVTQQ